MRQVAQNGIKANGTCRPRLISTVTSGERPKERRATRGAELTGAPGHQRPATPPLGNVVSLSMTKAIKPGDKFKGPHPVHIALI